MIDVGGVVFMYQMMYPGHDPGWLSFMSVNKGKRRTASVPRFRFWVGVQREKRGR